MSWSINFIGTPEEVVKKLEDHSESLTGHNSIKDEYDGAMPHLIGLVTQNYGNENQKLAMNAYGSEVNRQRVCGVTLRNFDPLI
jgi:hypothetical protein